LPEEMSEGNGGKGKDGRKKKQAKKKGGIFEGKLRDFSQQKRLKKDSKKLKGKKTQEK